MSYFRTIDISLNDLTRRQRRTFSEALDIIAFPGLKGAELENAEARILKAKQPKAEARRIVQHHERENISRTTPTVGEIESSDVRELRTTLIRKLGLLYPSDGQTRLLNKIDIEVDEGTMTNERFGMLKAILLKMTLSDTDRQRRRDEAKALPCVYGGSSDV